MAARAAVFGTRSSPDVREWDMAGVHSSDRAVVVIVVVMLVMAFIVPSEAGAASPLTFGPSDDATVRESRPTNNYGASPVLEVDASSRKDALLRFDISGTGGATVASATLRLYAVDGSPTGGDFAIVTDTTWNQNTVTWQNAPAGDGGTLASLGGVSAGNWYDIDVTDLVSGDGPVSLRVSSTNANGADYASSEHTNGNAPQLMVVTASP